MDIELTQNKRYAHWHSALTAFAAIAFLGLIAGTKPAAGKDLNLSTIPLFTGSNVKPNVLVAVDDSGSMDFETLFPTNSGLLYWNRYRGRRGFVGSDGKYSSDSDISYAYLFPNDCNDYRYNDRRVYCNTGDSYEALPPLPQFGFARSSEYNSAYFNPSVTYTPWLGMDNANPEKAFSDPSVKQTWLNLTDDVRQRGTYESFLIGPEMVIPAGTYIYNNGYWGTSNNDRTANSFFHLPIQYYPATFYLKAGTALPSNYGYNKQPIVGEGPNGDELKGYEIRPGNFAGGANSSAYKAAVQNFANWFTYYRKRHLATRGSIVSAFDQISRIKSGQCTINDAAKNNPDDLTMRDLDKDEDRAAFYSSIFNIDFTDARGTPNRKALQFLGSQLETNRSIINYPCQQNFAILFTDGFNTDGVKNSVGNADGDDGPSGNDGPPFADSYPNTIADVAMHYYENLGDLAGRTNPNKGDYVPRNQIRLPAGCADANRDPSLDCEKDLHMITYGVTLDQKGLIFNNNSYDAENRDPYTNPPNWPDPNPGYRDSYGIEQIDDLWHAAINSRGELLNATTPQEVADKFASALEKILNIAGAASGIAANGRRLASDTQLYQASFVGGVWNGELSAYPLGSDIGTTTPDWTAAKQLSQRSPNDRSILTSAKESGKYKGIAFDNALANSRNDISATEIQYIRGDRSSERRNNGELRNRGSNILGDIVHSTPLYVGAPDSNRYPAPGDWTDLLHPDSAPTPPEKSAQAYYSPSSNSQAFAQQHAQREPMVYVGANDGMLHGFSASDGAEKIAYIPNLLIPSLRDLAQTDYVHRYYVDGSPAEGDVVFDGKWHTVLVSGLANGGKGVFALDVTNPEDFSESNAQNIVLWEFTDPKLGKTYGQPSIVRLHNGKWAAMVANGYNSNDGKGSASLFLLDIQTGKPIGGKPIETGVGATNNTDASNGLSEAFPVDLDGDFITDYAYAGDLYGNVWRFDLTSTNPGDWHAIKLFTAKNVNDEPQPITTAPQVAFHPYGKGYGVMVYFGTGKYLEENDAAVDKSLLNSIYGIWDRDVFIADGESGSNGDVSRNRLVKQSVKDVVTDSESTYRVLSNNAVNYDKGKPDTTDLGWVLDLPPDTGELVIDNPRIEDGTLRLSTTIPTVQSCTAGGSGFFMRIDLATGGRTNEPVFDLNGDLKFTRAGDTTKSSEGEVGVSGQMFSQAGPGGSVTIDAPGSSSDFVGLGNGAYVEVPAPPHINQRRSWREIRR